MTIKPTLPLEGVPAVELVRSARAMLSLLHDDVVQPGEPLAPDDVPVPRATLNQLRRALGLALSDMQPPVAGEVPHG